MKKLIAIVLLAALAVGTGLPEAMGARKKKVNSGAVTSLVREYNLYEGFEVISVGGIGLRLFKLVASSQAKGDDERLLLDLADDIRKIIIVEYASAEEGKKNSFNRKLSDLLEEAEKIIEVKDEGDALNVYGTASRGDRIDDVIVYIPEECTLICLFGSISSQKVAELLEMEM